MIRVYIASAKSEERSALRRMLAEQKMQVVGESSDWFTTLAKAPSTNFNLLLVDWDILPMNAATGLSEIRQACTYSIIVVLASQRDVLKQVALSAGADAFINKSNSLNSLPDQLQAVIETLNVNETIR
jgi:DNA-binding NarL/FixJ family response regulator